MENRFVVVHERANGQWELQGLIRYDDLRVMGCLVPIKKEVYYEHRLHFLKIAYNYKAILNLQSQPHKTNRIKRKTIETT